MADRASPELGGGRPIRVFKPPVGPLPVVLSRSKKAHLDRLDEGFQKVESARIAGVPAPEKTTGACQSRAVLHARPIALGACRRVGARGWSEKSRKNLGK